MVNRQSDVHWRTLLLLTLVAGVLRFSVLDRPALWGDEAASWRRITGTYQQLVDELRSAGFQPGHYLLTWWIKEGFPIAFERRLESPEDAAMAARTRGFRQGWFPRRPEPTTLEPREVIVPTRRLIEEGLEPTPFVMRFVPALCGTLLVPAMYFLASQLVARRTALLVALFTCVSAYQLGYSRDAKMYAQLWFFATLHVACLLWWLKAYRRPGLDEPRHLAPEYPKQAELGEGVAGVLPGQHVGHIARAFSAGSELTAAPTRLVVPPISRLNTSIRWACWMTSGLAMIAFHAVGLGIVGIELLIFLATMPQRAGLLRRSATAILSPALYVVDRARDRRAQRNAARSRLVAEDPLDVLEQLNAEDAAPYAVAAPRERRSTTLTRHFAAVAAPSGPSPREQFRERLSRFALPPIVGFTIGAIAIVSLWSSYREFTRFYDRVTDTDSSVRFDATDAGISWVEPYNEGRTAAGHFLENASAYLLSWEWPKRDWVADVDPEVHLWLSRATAVLLIAAAVGLVPWRQAWSRVWRGRRPRQRRRWRGDEPTLASISQPQPVDVARRFHGPMPITAMWIVAVWLLVPAYAFYTASGAWTADGARTRAVTPTQAVVNAFYPAGYNDEAKTLAGSASLDVANAMAANESWDGLRDRLARRPWSELFVVRGIDWSQPRWPWLWPVVGVGFLVLALSRPVPWHRRLNLFAMGAGTIVLLWLLLLVTYVATPVQPMSIWMPRYLGFVWPAFAIAFCVLLMRLPFAPLRWAIVALLVVANLVNFVARVRYGEPPTYAMADDMGGVVERPTSRVFVIERSNVRSFGSPGMGRMFTMPNVYYAAARLDWDLTPRDAERAVGGKLRSFASSVRDASDLSRQLRRAPSVDEIIVWAELPAKAAEGDIERELAVALGTDWQRAEPIDRRMIYDHWNWRRLYVLERHRWVRASAATMPTSRPTAVTRPAPNQRAGIAPRSVSSTTRPTAASVRDVPATRPTAATRPPTTRLRGTVSPDSRTSDPRVSTTQPRQANVRTPVTKPAATTRSR